MRLNDSKNKRMLIMEQISMRQRSRERQRKSSAQRRSKIEQNLHDFMKTMSNVSFRNTGNSSGFRYDHPYSQNHGIHQDPEKHKESQKKLLKQEYDHVLRSPSFKDINLGRQDQQKMELSNEYIKLSHFGNTQPKPELEQKQQNKIQEEEIRHNNSGIGGHQMEKLTPNSIIVQNESSASAIFFTSQFNEFISKNHLSSREKLQAQKEQQSRQKQANHIVSSNTNLAESTFKIHQKNQQNNQSPNKQSSSTSGVKFYLPKEQQIIDPIAEENNQIIPQTMMEEERISTLLKNKSGHSLAFSNESSLKYSLNESNIKQILNRKFTNQLIADTLQFDPYNQDSSLYHHLKLQIIADKNLTAHRKIFFKEFTLFTKIVQLSNKVQKRQKRMYFQAFIINQELIFQEKVSEIKCDKFWQEKQQQKLKNVFDSIKFNFFTFPRTKLQKAIQLELKRQKNIKQKIFRCLKIAWYDQKVKKQIELYYLSKLFSHFTRVIKAQKQLTRNKCLSFYCMNLKKRYFKHLKQGVDNLQSQRIQKDNAVWHYNFGLQRKIFDAWKDRLSYKDRYISLAMTTKNTFKQTRDQKWLQIKTVDFKQIKYQ